MVRIRFRRVGARNQPSFRIVAADKDSPRDGRFLEVLGSYNPRTEPSTVKVDEARLFHWMSNGAQPSESVVQTLQTVGTWERWERFKGGESLETLVQEAEAAQPDVDPRTRRDDQIGQRSKKRRKHADAPKAEAESKAEAEPADDAPEAEAEHADDAPEAEAADEATAEAEGADDAPEADAEPVDDVPEPEEANDEPEPELEGEAESDKADEDVEAEGNE